MSDDLISIIVITYNSESTVIETLESIRNQTYDNIEIIISDDCSSDGTVEAVRTFLERQNNVTLVTSNENTGVSANINRGINASRGKYIKIIAGDDKLEKNAIERFYAASKKYNGIVVCEEKCFGVDAIQIRNMKNYYDNHRCFFSLDNEKQLDYLLKINPICAPAVGLIERKIYNRIGFYDEKYKYMEDYPFWIKCALNGIRFYMIQEQLADYRVSSVSLTGKKKGKLFLSNKAFFFDTRLRLLLKRRLFFSAFCNLIYYIT